MMLLFSKLCADVAFIVARILERPDIQGKRFNACIKLIKRLCIMFVWALMGHISNKIFKMEYEAHAYGIELEFENVLKKVKLKKNNSFFIFK